MWKSRVSLQRYKRLALFPPPAPCLLGAFLAALLLVLPLHQAQAEDTQAKTKAPLYTSATLPFTPLQRDAWYRPHQLIPVGLLTDAAGTEALPAVFLFDTGSNTSAISASLAKKMRLPLFALKNLEGAQMTAFGQPLTAVMVPLMQLGSIRVEGVVFSVLPDAQLAALGQVDGILAPDVFGAFAVHMDFTNKQLTIIAPAMPLRYETLYSTPANLSASEVVRLGFSDALTVPLIVRNQTVFSIRGQTSNGQTAAEEMLLLDTGNDTTAISEPVARRLALKPTTTQAGSDITGDYTKAVSWLSSLRCGGLILSDLLVDSPEVSSIERTRPGFDPRLGLDVLVNYDVLLDFPHRKMYLKPRTDFQAITSRQYRAASAAQRRQWAQGRPIITYAASSGLYGSAIPYELDADGLPIAQVRPEPGGTPVPFLLKTNTSGTFITVPLAAKWGLNTVPVLTADGKPDILRGGQPILKVTVPRMRLGGSQWKAGLAVIPPAMGRQRASGLPVEGVIGGNLLFSGPLLMDPRTLTWVTFDTVTLAPDDLKSLEMDDAAMLDLLASASHNVPACAAEVREGNQKRTETLDLATGSPFTLLSAEAAQALKLTPEPQKLKYGTGAEVIVFNQSRVSQLSVGNVVLENVLIAYPDGAMPKDFSPRLGMDVISRLRLLVDMPGKKLYVKKAAK